MDASIVIVGDEILSGHVREANAHFIAIRLAVHGHTLRRIAIVPDEPREIAASVARETADPAVDIVFVCGGLGPTHDDRTMEGVASALDVPLEPCAPIAARIAEIAGHVRAEAFDGDPLGLEGLRKMALAPAGSQALECASGVIPAVTVTSRSTRLFILPGPPREMQAVFTECVEPQYLEGKGTIPVREEIEHEFPESALAVVLADVEASIAVKIGSYPGTERVLIRVAGDAESVASAAKRIRHAIDTLAASADGQRLLALMRSRREERARKRG
ncbi:MAG TPA: competence/damage-inducible protein A [Actinomycetota bacterium]